MILAIEEFVIDLIILFNCVYITQKFNVLALRYVLKYY